MEISIKVEVHVLLTTNCPQYRLYVNDDLITERLWIWDATTVIEENVTVDLSPNQYHSIWVKAVDLNNPFLGSQLAIKSLKINGKAVGLINEHRSEISFLLDEHKYTKLV